MDRRRRRPRGLRGLLLLTASILLVAAATAVGSGAVFTSSSANPSNVFSAGNLHHSNSKDGSAVLTASKMKPLDTAQGTVTIQNDGDIAGTFSLVTSNLTDTAGANGGKLSQVLRLQIVDQTSGTTIYNGALNAVGTLSCGTFAAGASHTYQFTVTFPDGGVPSGPSAGDNAYKASSVSIEFDWTEVQ
jgi:spore coat-associated protein N